MPELNPLELLEEQYFTLHRSFGALYAACTTEPERMTLRMAYENARDNYWAAKYAPIIANDPFVVEIAKEIAAVNKEINQRLRNLKKISEVLNLITGAVRLGSSIIMMGMGVPPVPIV